MKFNLKKYAQASEMNPVINGTSVQIYHRTGSQDVVGNICESGFIAGNGDAYGAGIYANYSLASAMAKFGLGTYGGIVIKGSVNLSGFVIFDYEIAEQIYGNNYRLPHQIERMVGWDKILSSPSPEEIEKAKKILWGYHQKLKSRPKFSSSVAQSFISQFRASQRSANGILFTGHNDGNTVVVFSGGLVVPEAHAFVDNRTKGNFKWQKCPEVSREALEDMVEAVKDSKDPRQLEKERTQLIKDLSSAIGKSDPSSPRSRGGNQNRAPQAIKRENYPSIPDSVFDSLLMGVLYRDPEVMEKLPKETKDRVKEGMPVHNLIRKLQSEPILYWEEYKTAPPEIKNKIPRETLRDIWQAFVDANPLKWKEIDEPVRRAVDKTNVISYYVNLVNAKPQNMMYVPEDLIEDVTSVIPVSDKKMQQIEDQKVKSDIISEESEEFVIPLSSMGWFENQIDKLNNKAAKLGLPPVVVNVVKEDLKSYTKTIRIVRNIPIFSGGWELVGKIMPMKDPDTGKMINKVTKLGTKAVPEEYLTIKPDCQHGEPHKRNRNEIFILYGNETNEYKMVGSTCLNAFVGDFKIRPDQIAKFAETLQKYVAMFRDGGDVGKKKDPDVVRKKFKKEGIPLPYFLSRCLMVGNKEGYMSGGQAYKNRGVSTGTLAYNACIDEKIDNKYYQDLSSSDIVLIDNTIDWLYGLDQADLSQMKSDGDDYLYNLVASVGSGEVEKAGRNFVASAPNAYKRSLEDGGMDQQQLLDNKGSEVYFSATMTDKRPLFFQIQTGQSTQTGSNFCIAENEKGEMVVWGDNTGFKPDIGNAIQIKAKVVGFTVMDGKTATVLESVDIIPIEEYQQQAAAQEQRTKAFRDGEKVTPLKKKIFKNGDLVDQTFTISDVKPTRKGSIFYQVTDGTGNKLSFFTPPPALLNAGDPIHVRGVIAINGNFININNPQIIDDTGKAADMLQDGDVLEKTFHVVDTYTDSYQAGYKTVTKEMFVVEDENDVQFEFGITNSTGSLQIGDYAVLKGKTKLAYGGKWKLLRVKLISMGTPPTAPATPATPATPAPLDPQTIKQQAPTSQDAAPTDPQAPTSQDVNLVGGLNWYEKSIVLSEILKNKNIGKTGDGEE